MEHVTYTDKLGYTRRVLRLERHGVFVGDFRTVEELGQHVDVATLREDGSEPSEADGEDRRSRPRTRPPAARGPQRPATPNRRATSAGGACGHGLGRRSWSAPGTTAWSPRTCSPTPAGPCWCWRPTRRPGGATRTAELAAPGFRSELCSAFYPLTAASPTIAALGLGRYGLRWRHDHVPLVHVLPDGRTVTLSRDPAETAASVERYAAGDGERWLAEFAAWGRMKDALLGSLLSPFPPVRSGRAAGPPARRRPSCCGSPGSPSSPPAAYGRELFRGEGARLLVTGNAMHADLTLDTSGGAILGWLLSMLAQDVGFPVAEGGAQSITDALVRRLEAAWRRDPLRRPGDRGRGPGRCRGRGPHRRRRGVPRRPGRCWPTCPPRRSTGIWSGWRSCPPGWPPTWPTSTGTTRP